MEQEKDTQIESAEELEAEQKNLAEVNEDDIRKEVISEYGFDEDTDSDKIEKAVARETRHRKSLSQTIGQKIKYRNELQGLKSNPQRTDPSKAKADDDDLDSKLNQALEKRDLESMEYPDDIKTVIKQVADINKISVRKAVADPYVASKIAQWEKQNNAEEASLKRNNKGGKATVATDDELTPPDVDLDTDEGRKEYDKWKSDMIKKGY